MGEAKDASKLMPSLQEKVAKTYGKGGAGEGLDVLLESGNTSSQQFMKDQLR